MANPYEKFGPGLADQAPTEAAAVAEAQTAPAADASVPGVTPAAAQDNPYAAMTAAAPEVPAEPMPLEQFQDELYKRLNDPKGGDVKEIVEWAKSTGHNIIQGPELAANWEIAQRNRRGEGGGNYGRVALQDNSLDAGDIWAFFRGAADTATLDKASTISAAAKAALGIGEGDSFSERWDRNIDANNAQVGVDEVLSPGSRALGQATGIGLAALLPVGAMRGGAPLIQNALRGGSVGALEGAVQSTDVSSQGLDTTDTGQGALIGGTIGAAAPGIVAGGARLARPVIDAVGTRMAGRGGTVNALARRVGLEPEQMAENAAALRAQGIDPTLYDVVGETGQDLVGAMARRQTPARGAYQEFADKSRLGLPDRVRSRAAILSSDARTPDDIVAAAQKGRNTQMEAAMEPLRPLPVPLDEGSAALDILRTGEGANALRAAAQLEKNPEVKRAMLELARPPKLPEGAAEIQKLHDEVKAMGLPPAAEQAALAQLPPLPEAAARVMTVDMADKIARSFNDAAEAAGRAGKSGRAGVLRQYGRDVRNAAAEVHPEYRAALDQYGDESRLVDAVRLGEGVTARNTDEFVRNANKLRSDPITEPGTATTTSERELARAGARRAVERTVEDNAPGSAFAAAETLATAEGPRQRLNALVGEDTATAFREGLGADLSVARARMRTAPRSGSRTALNEGDDAAVGSMANVLANPTSKTAWISAGIRSLSKAGISDNAAERIVNMAIDPTPGAVERAIDELARLRGGNRAWARYMIESVRGTGIRTQDDEDRR
jgi:hypothetical protein